MFEGMDMNSLMAQAQQMQEQLLAAQHEQAARRFTGSAGGEMVKATISGDGDLVELQIAPQAADPEDTETLSELVIAAFRSAKSQADESMQGLMPQMPGGLPGAGPTPGMGF